ncbi:MAG TPA: alpha/beta hydrolase [Patescibacteria group bacterium]|jgi:pimeloyl-ACP methyl ester carboxylesterase|nr:alpha/beta hydrolase [Patescibacteria group bacterium]
MTLYVIHGWAYSIEPWNDTIAELKQRGIDVVMLRVPGLTEPSTDIWTIDRYVTWLDEALASVDQPIVLGHSNGGRIALHYLLKHPGRFKQLILLASAGVETQSNKLSFKRRVFGILSKVFAPLKSVPYVRKIVYRLLGSDYGSAPDNMKQTLANMLASDKGFDASSITTPTTLLYGTADATTPPAMGKKLEAQLPHATLEVIEGWNHAPYRAHATELAQKIAQILEEST